MSALERARPRDYEILAAWNRLQDNAAVASELGISVNTVRGSISRARGMLKMARPERSSLYDHLRAEKVNVDLPTYEPVEAMFEGDMIVCADLHVPTCHYSLIELMATFGKKMMRRGKRHLVIVGDLVNHDGLSKYEVVAPAISLKQEWAAARAVMAYLLTVFDKIEVVSGNHDQRLQRALHGAVDASDFGRLILDFAHDPRVRVHTQSQIILRSGGEEWRATHPSTYSRNALKTADNLASKYASNIISFHEHFIGITRDTWGKFSIVNGGGFFDVRKMAYVGIADSTAAAMKLGFVYLEQGTAHLLTPYPTMTSWAKWGLAEEAQPVIDSICGAS